MQDLGELDHGVFIGQHLMRHAERSREDFFADRTVAAGAEPELAGLQVEQRMFVDRAVRAVRDAETFRGAGGIDGFHIDAIVLFAVENEMERIYKVATILHAILFIVMSVVRLFSSDVGFTMYAMQNMVGKEYYQLIRSVFTENTVIIHASISSLIVVEVVTFVTVSIVAIVSLIKGFKKLVKFFQVKKNNQFVLYSDVQSDLYPNRVQIDNSCKTYLIFGRLLNQ